MTITAGADARLFPRADASPYPRGTQVMIRGNGPRYDHAANVTAEILDLHSDPDTPKHLRFARILFAILAAMEQAEQEFSKKRWEPSQN